MTKILAFAGSSRKNSYNQAVVEAAAKGAAQAGAEVTILDWADYDMPLFNEDLEAEQGIPARAQAFKELLMAHDGFLIATPEYNSSYPALLKNAIDWATRQAGEEPMLGAFRGKVVGIMAASQGALGGIRVLPVLRNLLSNIGVLVLPNQQAVGKVHTLLNEQGELVDEKKLNALKKLGHEVAEAAAKLAN